MSIIIVVLVFSKLPYFCSKDFTSRRKQRGRAHCGLVQVQEVWNEQGKVDGEKSKSPGENPSPEAPGLPPAKTLESAPVEICYLEDGQRMDFNSALFVERADHRAEHIQIEVTRPSQLKESLWREGARLEEHSARLSLENMRQY
jgi:hypothetical protein